MSASAPKISFQHVTRRFGDDERAFVALDDFNLDIADGEFVTVVGPSGCGKSTAMNIAAGLLPASSGRVLVDGRAVAGPGPERGVIFQQYALFPWLTVRQNVEFGLRIKGMPAAERRRISDHFIGLVGLTDFADALPKTLSGGMKQRCAIARAYAVNPTMLLMDEPFGALDALTRQGLQDEVLRIAAETGLTVVFITHDLEEALYLGDRVVLLGSHPGRIEQTAAVDLPRPRNQLGTREDPRFLALRRELFGHFAGHAA